MHRFHNGLHNQIVQGRMHISRRKLKKSPNRLFDETHGKKLIIPDIGGSTQIQAADGHNHCKKEKHHPHQIR